MKAHTLKAAYKATQNVYEREAQNWHNDRANLSYEKAWLDRFLNHLPETGRILDLGCGSGHPVSAYFIERGYACVGVDYARSMIDIATSLYPNAHWHVGDIRDLPTDLGVFDGICSWDGFFHLSAAEQRAALPNICASVRPQGALILTVGTGEGEVIGTVAGETVYHASLSPDEYEKVLRGCGFSQVIFKPEDPDCMGRSVLIAWGKV